MQNLIKNLLKPRLKLIKGTRMTSFLFIAVSIVIAAGILFAANIYYNIDTGEIVMEEIQRVTQVIRATAGLIVGGTATQNPSSGYTFQVVGQSLFATTTFATGTVSLTATNQELRFYGGTSYYVGLKATTTLATTTTYILPPQRAAGADYVLTWQPGDQLTWKSIAGAGGGTITAVGNVTSGEAFTQTGTQGTSLWFYDPQGRGQLTIADLTAARTYTLPNLSGTIALQSPSTLTQSGVLFADANGLITQDSNFTYSSNRLQVGSNGIRLLGATSGYIELKAAATSDNTTYTWPGTVVAGRVLTTDGSGNLSWATIGGVGGISGGGTAGQVAFFDDATSITGTNNFTWSTTTNTLTITGTIVGSTFTGPSGATTTIASASGQNILLDPASGKIILGSSDYIQTASGYEIGKTGTQELREMIPIMGFDLPVWTATTSYVQISRTIVNYPFSPCVAGTTRIHKLVVRYGSTATSTWQIATSTEITFPSTNATSTGSVYTAEIEIPTPSGACTTWSQGTDTTDWYVKMKLDSSGEIMIYQIFLAAYDQIQ